MNNHLSAEKRLNLTKENLATQKLPVNFIISDKHIFAGDLEKHIPETKILEYENVKISAEGIIFHNNKILLESFATPANFKSWKKRTLVKTYLQNLLLRKNSIKENVLWVTDDWSGGYFHWLCDAMPKLVVASEVLKSVVLLLPTKFKNLDFAVESLEILGVENVEFINENETVSCGKIFLPTHAAISGDFNKSVMKEVRRLFVEKAGLPKDDGFQKIYISRKKAHKRKVLNEEEILDVLSDYGFRTIYTEDYSFPEQIELFNSTKYLISIHGAGLTNMLFMPEESSVLELRKNDKELTNCYFNMSSALDINYYYQLCDSENMNEAPHTANITVDKAVLTSNLERFLS